MTDNEFGEESDWETLFPVVAAAAVGLAGLGIYAVTTALKARNNERIVVALDATPIKCAGLIRLPKHKEVYFYSVNWTAHYKFDGPQQIPVMCKMVNAIVAMSVFENLLKTNQLHYSGKPICKTDNTVCKPVGFYKDPQDESLLTIVREILNNINAEMVEAHSENDQDMRNAIELSVFKDATKIQEGYGRKVAIHDLSARVVLLLPKIAEQIPAKYRKVQQLYELHNPQTVDNRNRREQDEGNGWGRIFLGLAGAAAVLGVGAAILANRPDNEPSPYSAPPAIEIERYNNSGASRYRYRDSNLCTSSMRPRPQGLTLSEMDRNRIVIAVDATPRKCGGLIRLPKQRKIFYYSVNWTAHFKFDCPQQQVPDIFETVNTFVALHAFEHVVNKYQKCYYEAPICKTDNTVCNKTKPYNDREDQHLLTTVREKLNRLNAQWKEAHIADDLDMENANNLSRYGNEIQQPKGYDWDMNLVDLSEHVKQLLPDIELEVPRRYKQLF